MTVTGSGFAIGTGTTVFEFGKAPATGVECSSTRLTLITPAAKKPGVLDIVAAVGKSKSKKNPPADQYAYE